jgi:membrane protein DedA with SNARE-associated domain
MLVFAMTMAALNLFTGTYTSINTFISIYGYIAIVVLLAMPLGSEVILPLIGHFAQLGDFNFFIALVASLVGTMIGITVFYYLAYLLEKEVVYRHLGLLHIKKSSLDSFDEWFGRNGAFAVFVSRLLPVVRGVMSLPAGFARMNLKDFYLYSMTGSLIWNVALMGFGYYALSTTSVSLLFIATALFAIALYVVYRIGLERINNGR